MRPALPYTAATTGSAYEFVLLESGVSEARARSLAARSMWSGKQGRLARLDSTALQDLLANHVPADARGWVDAESTDGTSNSFEDSDNNSVDDSVFASGTSFALARPRGAYAYAWPKDALHRLGHAHPGAFIGGERAGFWVEYENVGSSSFAASEGSFFDAVAAFFDGAFADDEEAVAEADPVVFPAPPPDCLAEDSLACFPDSDGEDAAP